MSTHAGINAWVEECTQLCQPDRVFWCDGSEEENQKLLELMLDRKVLHELNPRTYPNCYLHRSNPNDIARVESCTFICSEKQDNSGPTNNWMSPREAKDKARPIFAESMKGRTMYVVPYLMGPAGSPFARTGIELTDSPYVVANMRTMTRMGNVAMEHLSDGAPFVPGLHSSADLNPQRRYVLHFPEERLIWSVGSGYGGNALLGKKCFALRIASALARGEGWLAEHMLILGLEDPSGVVTYMAAAFPSACGKTNLAMLVPPAALKGWKVWTVGDDIAWMHIGSDGRLWAVNPEAGFFGVAPGTNANSNPNAMATLRSNAIFTNTALTPAGEPWWEGMDDPAPAGTLDWQGRLYNAGSGEKAAHPNSRFTAAARQCPIISPRWEDPQGVPISALIFGGRRSRVAPLVYEAFNWNHGVFVGAQVTSETTAAATGQVGVLRRDPMAMLPFCGYNMGDYFAHWLAMGQRISRPPRIFHVNWFRKSPKGDYLWPGFGENLRVLQWILGRVRGEARGVETPLGFIPALDDLDFSGLQIGLAQSRSLLSIDYEAWQEELPGLCEFFAKFGPHMPAALHQEGAALASRLGANVGPWQI